jgi:hypothetical protein
MTHVLRLLKHFILLYKNTFHERDHQLNSIIHSINYSNDYGSEEVKESGLPNRINNVEDAFLKFTEIMKLRHRIRDNEYVYHDKPKIGDIYVYCNSEKNMEYIPAP